MESGVDCCFRVYEYIVDVVECSEEGKRRVI